MIFGLSGCSDDTPSGGIKTPTNNNKNKADNSGNNIENPKEKGNSDIAKYNSNARDFWHGFMRDDRRTGFNKGSKSVVDNPVQNSLFEHDHSIASQPISVGGNIIFITDNSHRLFSISKSGRVVWSLKIKDIISMSEPSLEYSEGILYLSNGDTLRAIDTESQEQVWENSLDYFSLEKYPASINEGYITITNDHSTHLLDSSSGDEIFTYEMRSTDSIVGSPIVRNGRIFIPSNEGIISVLIEKKKENWTYLLDDVVNMNGYMATDGNNIYYQTDEALHKVRMSDGSQLWRVDMSGNAPIVTEDNILTMPFNHTVRIIDKESGNNIRDVKGENAFSRPAVSDGMYYITNQTNTLVAFNLNDGSSWSHDFDDAFDLTNPIVADNKIIVGGANPTGGVVYEISREG